MPATRPVVKVRVTQGNKKYTQKILNYGIMIVSNNFFNYVVSIAIILLLYIL